MPLADQAISFLWTVAIGMLAGFCYELYKATRDMLKLKKIGTFAGDILYWLFLTILVFALLIKANYGQLRLYFFIGLLLGVFLFVQFLGDYSYRLIKWIFKVLARFLKLVALFFFYVWMVLIFPFRIAFITIAFPFRIMSRAAGTMKRFISQRIGRPIASIKTKISSFADRVSKKFSPPQ